MKRITMDSFEKVFESVESDICDLKECNVYAGLKIITKYCPSEGIEGADHDIIYSVGVESLVDAGISEEDVKQLARLNWMIQNEYLACFV